MHTIATLQSFCRALKYLDEAEACITPAGSSATLCFIRLKIHLDVGDVAAAEAQIQRACACSDFTPSILEVSACS